MEDNLKQCRFVIDKAVAEGAKVRHENLYTSVVHSSLSI